MQLHCDAVTSMAGKLFFQIKVTNQENGAAPIDLFDKVVPDDGAHLTQIAHDISAATGKGFQEIADKIMQVTADRRTRLQSPQKTPQKTLTLIDSRELARLKASPSWLIRQVAVCAVSRWSSVARRSH